MGFYADPWLREARDRIEAHPEPPPGRSDWRPTDFDKVSEAVERAIKAALIERNGSIPHEHDDNKLVSLCQTTGVWDVLPPALRSLVEEVESYRAANSAKIGSIASSPEQLQRYFFIARRLIDYMEYHVIGNDSVLRRLKVA
jgi:HEPN domain-containing protein